MTGTHIEEEEQPWLSFCSSCLRNNNPPIRLDLLRSLL